MRKLWDLVRREEVKVQGLCWTEAGYWYSFRLTKVYPAGNAVPFGGSAWPSSDAKSSALRTDHSPHIR